MSLSTPPTEFSTFATICNLNTLAFKRFQRAATTFRYSITSPGESIEVETVLTLSALTRSIAQLRAYKPTASRCVYAATCTSFLGARSWHSTFAILTSSQHIVGLTHTVSA